MEPSLISYGESYTKDFRSQKYLAKNPTVKILAWNIERGYKLPQIVQQLKQIDADILLLQEVDVCTGRCDDGKKTTNCGEHIASELQLNCLMACEMKLLEGGIQCNAILTKFNFVLADAYVHESQIIDWETLGPLCKENGLGKDPR
jgi:endonuclease/exonuclease/phosphatase family metal-dependent hydrolase